MKNYVLEDKVRGILFWCVMAVILFTRFYCLNRVPGDINQDEAFAGYNAYTLAHGGKDSFGNILPMFFTAWGSGMNVLESYLSVPFIALFGTHAWVIRLVPGICAVLTLVLVYLIFRKTTNDILALFAFFFAGIMPWHIMLSRCAIETGLAPAFLLFAFFFFLKGIEKEKYFLLSALFYGLALYADSDLWAFLPFLLFFEVLYLFLQKKMHRSRYTVGSAVILAVFYLPVCLFVMVNHDLLLEIRLPFLTIPKMVYYKGSEISFLKIPSHIKNLWNIFWTQNDGFPWNTTEKSGLFYKISMPFALAGLVYMVVMAVRKRKEKHFSIEYLWLLQFFTGLAGGILIQGNVNRLNFLFLPVICMTIYGLYVVFAGVSHLAPLKEWKYYLLLAPVLVYSAFFSHFASYYFTEYGNMMHGYFCYGLEETFSYALKNLDESTDIFVTPNASYARVLFYSKTDGKDYLETVEYSNYPSAYLDVSSFDRYYFIIDDSSEPDGDSAYLLDSTYNSSFLVQTMERNGYEKFSAGNYTLWYPESELE